jgi:hypothetical protein
MATQLPHPPDFGRNIPPDEGEVQTPETPDDKLPLDMQVEEQEDGSAIVTTPEGDDPPDETEFGDNLAEHIDSVELSRIAVEITELIDRDRDARKKRDEQYAEGIKRTGLGGEAPGGASFSGAANAVHPVLAEGCVDFGARVMKEIFPAKGVVKTKILGKADEEKLVRAERKKAFMNWQLTTQIPEFRAELEQLEGQVPLGGSQYLKIWPDKRLKRPRVEFIPIDDVLLPFATTYFYGSARITHQTMITELEFNRRVKSGLYRDVTIGGPGMDLFETSAGKASDKVEGRQDYSFNEDGLRRVYEVAIEYDLSAHDKRAEDVAPYIIHIDEPTRTVLAIYRNWDEKDALQRKLDWMVDFSFIPWRGAYAIGLPHLIGSLAGALTGAVRALLDSAHINNFPGAIKLRGGRVAGQSLNIEPTQIVEIEGPAGLDDIRKLAMPLPFNPPSAVLFQLLDWITNQAKGVVATAEEKIADARNEMPVGTALALIEQGSITFSSIFARQHASMAKVLEILHRINRDYLPEQVDLKEYGGDPVTRKDFEGPIDIVPVSDPNIFSETQRYAQFQAVLQMATNPAMAQNFNMGSLARRGLMLLNWSDPDEILTTPPDPEPLDPVMENVMAGLGKQPIKSYPHQDHLAHLQVHLHFMSSPIFCANQFMGSTALAPLLAHCKEHLLELYAQHLEAASASFAGTLGEVMGVPMDGVPPERVMVKAQAFADQQLAQMLAPLMPLLQSAQQLAGNFAAQNMANQPMDPGKAQIQIKQMEIAAQQAADQQNNQQKQAAEQLKASIAQQQQQMQAQQDEANRQTQQQIEAFKQQNENQRRVHEDSTKQQIEAMRLQHQQALAQQAQQHEQSMAQMQAAQQAQQAQMQQFVDGGRVEREQAAARDTAHRESLHKITELLSARTTPVTEGPKPDKTHIDLMNKLMEKLTADPVEGEVQAFKHGGHVQAANAGAIGQLTETLGQVVKQQAEASVASNQALAQAIVGPLTQVLEQNRVQLETMLEATRRVADAADTVAEGHDDVAQRLDSLHQAVRAPRRRTLIKDKKTGAKTVIDTPED